MKRPVQTQSDMAARALRRDAMVGTAALVLVESGLLAAAAVMAGLSAEAEQPEADSGAGEAARKARPANPSKPLPNMQVDMGGGPSPLPYETSDDTGLFQVDFTRMGGGSFYRAPDLAGAAVPGMATTDPGVAAGWRGGESAAPSSPSRGMAGPSGSSGGADSPSPPPVPEPQELKVTTGTDGDDVITGTEVDDYVFGRDGDDTLHGGGGNDRLLGGNGDDTLFGGAGNDILVGDKGNDAMTGGAGADTFVFRSGFGNDIVTDFKADGDRDVVQVAKSEFADFAALFQHLADTDLGTVLTLHDGSTLTLRHVSLSSLSASDFRFDV